MNDVILAIDIGTTNIKCVVARRNMQFLADAECEYKTHSPEFLFYEQDCEDWWTHCKLAISRALAKAGTSAADVAAIAVSAQAPTFLPVARDGSPLCPAMIWMDRRSDRQCRQMELDFGREAIFRATGNVPDPFYMFGELLWFKENMPQQYEKTACVLQANGYVNYRLTGEMTIDRTNASITQCYNVINEDWDDAILSKYGVSRAILPRIVDTDEVIGGVSAQASAETGIPAGTPVLGGAVDGAAAALEGGVSHQGRAVEMSGTSSVLLVGSESMHTSENLTYMYSAIRGQHLLLGCMSSTGGGLKWYRDNIFADKGEGCYAQMDRIIEKECPDPTRIVFLPYLAGERAPIWDSHAKGAFLGLTFDTNQGEMLRAVEEGAAFALMDNLREALRSGATIETLRAVGGNESCAKLSGINVKAVKVAVYTISGFCCGVAAMLLTSRLDSAVPTNAEGYEMNAIAAAVIGGVSMSGGEGSLVGTIIGAFMIGVIANGMNLLVIPTGPQRVVTGAIIVPAVILDVVRKGAANKAK